MLEPYSVHRNEIQEDMVDNYIDDLTGVTYRPTIQIALIELLEEMSDKNACSSMEIFDALGVSRQTYNYKRHINPLLDSHIIAKIEHKRTNNYYIRVLGRLYLMYLKKIYA